MVRVDPAPNSRPVVTSQRILNFLRRPARTPRSPPYSASAKPDMRPEMQPSMSSFHLPVDRNVVSDVGRVDMHLGFACTSRISITRRTGARLESFADIILSCGVRLRTRENRAKRMIRSTQSIATVTTGECFRSLDPQLDFTVGKLDTERVPE